ncbi:XkdX family protein [Brevibacillus agri]|nr:XkdX family protein [Brevibacillus agri]MED1652608.1 XkdX family protein [Brevibacillus agri]MED1689638.1 XkdX family protein [Brevibacillus agri]MED1691124.1 XkdX family protein [Brevibacillus agri]MED1696766.1 XkdX family protein [Brevibacillus agri]
MWFNTIKKWYTMFPDLYSAESIKVFVVAGYITPQQYKEITGIDYTPAA